MKIWAYRHMPILDWLPKYNIARDLKYDVIAGITVGMMIIPQEVSLTSIMGVPAVYGLYTAAITPMIYPIFGTSRVLSVANAAEVSLLVGAALESIVDEKERIATGILLSFYCGLIMLVMGLFHLGLVVDFFSRPVMGGFVSAGGILIMLSQVRNWFGVSFESSEYAAVIIYRLASNLHRTNIAAFVLGLFSIGLLGFLKYAKKNLFPANTSLDQVFETEETTDFVQAATPAGSTDVTWSFSLTDNQFLTLKQQRAPTEPPIVVAPKRKTKLVFCCVTRLLCDMGALFVCLIGILSGYILDDIYDYDIALTGHVPSGLPTPVLPWSELGNLIPASEFGRISFNAFAIAIIAYMSSIAMAKRLAIKDGYEVNPNQELLGIGIASVVGSFFQVMPPTGAMSRTAVNAQNAQTQLASVITSCMVILTLLFFTEPLVYLPKATLAAIIIVAAHSLIELEEAKWLYRVKRDEFWVWMASFILTVALGVLPGLIASIASSLLAIMWRTKRPPLIRLGRLENGTFVDTSLFDEAVILDTIEVVRIEGSLYFANCEYVEHQMEVLLTLKHKTGAVVKGIVIDACSINDWDATAIQVMKDLLEKLESRRIVLMLANVRQNLKHALELSGFAAQLKQPTLSLSVEGAVEFLHALEV